MESILGLKSTASSWGKAEAEYSSSPRPWRWVWFWLLLSPLFYRITKTEGTELNTKQKIIITERLKLYRDQLHSSINEEKPKIKKETNNHN